MFARTSDCEIRTLESAKGYLASPLDNRKIRMLSYSFCRRMVGRRVRFECVPCQDIRNDNVVGVFQVEGVYIRVGRGG